MPTYATYLIYTGLLAIGLVILVSRVEIKRLLIYGVLLGGMFDVFILLIVDHLLGAGGYINFGPFGFAGIPFFPPLAWSVWFIMFFYFLPSNRFFRYAYVAAAAAYSMLFANVLIHLGVFQWRYNRLWLAFLIYLAWYATAVFLQKRIERLVEE